MLNETEPIFFGFLWLHYVFQLFKANLKIDDIVSLNPGLTPVVSVALCYFSAIKNGASFCHCAYVLCISDLVRDIQVFLSNLATNAKVLLRGL